MRPVLSREQIRAFDASAIDSGVPGIVLMENAGRGAAHLIGLKGRPRTSGPAPVKRAIGGSCVRCADERALSELSFVLICGAGNNGGDGFVVGRHLLGRGARVHAVLLAEESSLTGDAQLAYRAYRAVGGRTTMVDVQSEQAAAIIGNILSPADLIVDALLGTGAARALEGVFRQAVLLMNEADAPVVSLDVPSGLDAETGRVLGVAVRAAHTVTFAHLKKGLMTSAGASHVGRITVSHIGVPAALPQGLEPEAWMLEEADVAAAMTARAQDQHKGGSGRVVVVGGRPGTVGAARLAGLGALRGGAGLVTLAGSRQAAEAQEDQVLELMTHRASWESSETQALLKAADALVLGPGLGRDEEADAAMSAVLAAARPTVIDADALRLLAQRSLPLAGGQPCVLTPHAGEAGTLLGISAAEVEADRYAAAEEIQKKTGAVVVLKGPRTLIRSASSTLVSPFGSAALATGGTGDVLSGVIAAQLAETGGDALLSARQGVALHGLAAEMWSEQKGDAGLLASEVAALIPEVRRALLRSLD